MPVAKLSRPAPTVARRFPTRRHSVQGVIDESWSPPPLWPNAAGYLNTATYGLPPRPAFDQLSATLDGWRRGTVPFEEWDEAADRGRRTFARLVDADPADVAIGATVSQMVAPLATAVPDGGTVLIP